MLRHFTLFLAASVIASLFLLISVFRIAQPQYVFSQAPKPTPAANSVDFAIDYHLPYPGTILADNILWPVKALRDRVWLTLTVDHSKKADLYLLIADKRLADAKLLFTKGKADLAISVLTKGEKYLELAQKEERLAHSHGDNTVDFLQRYIVATLKHRQVLDEILTIAPEDAKPLIVKTENYSKKLYEEAKNGLLEQGATAPENPFN